MKAIALLEVQAMVAAGATDFTECGPGKALQGMIAKIDRMKAQVKHNQEVIRKMKKREDKQDIDALINEVQAERLRRSEQSQRDKQRSRMMAAAKYREGIDKRIEDCLRMNGKIP